VTPAGPGGPGPARSADARLFFIHIPKTAGTSLRRIVRQQYPGDQFIPVYSHDPAELESVRRKLDDGRVLYGHFSHGLHETLETRGRYIALLRDPVARVLSLYRHQRNNPRASHHSLVNSGPTLRDLLDSNAIHELNNHMTRIVSGHVGIERLDDDAVLRRAVAHIERDFVLVGLVERMAETVALLSRLLDWRGTSELPWLNVGRSADSEPLDTPTRGAIERANRLDLALYHWAVARFERTSTENCARTES